MKLFMVFYSIWGYFRKPKINATLYLFEYVCPDFFRFSLICNYVSVKFDFNMTRGIVCFTVEIFLIEISVPITNKVQSAKNIQMVCRKI